VTTVARVDHGDCSVAVTNGVVYVSLSNGNLIALGP
jgi:hypothetical protein